MNREIKEKLFKKLFISLNRFQVLVSKIFLKHRNWLDQFLLLETRNGTIWVVMNRF